MPGSKWDRVYGTSELRSTPSPFIHDCRHLISDLVVRRTSPNGLDIAGGTGRNALAAAEMGVAMTIVDSSGVGLARANTWAEERSLSVETIERDLEAEGLPPGEWDLMIKTYFLDRAVLRASPEQLRPGGLLLFAQPTTTNLERHERPSRRFLIEPGELAEIVAAMAVDVEVLELSEDWRTHETNPDDNPHDNPHEARLILRRR